ncbi:MAG: ABC-2 type transporter [Thermotogales bacterium 46_20]|nr:MAG: ABC-2 type transporter [Thermotogales bacterium 46_20]
MLLLVIVFPILASLAVISVDGEPSYSRLKLAVVNEDRTFLGLFFANFLTSMLRGENIVEVPSRVELAEVLSETDGALIIPRGFANDLLFAKPSEIVFVPNTSRLYTSIAIYQVLNNALLEFRALPVIADPDFMSQVDLDPDYPPPRIVVESMTEQQMSMSTLLLPAVIAAGVMLLAGIGASWSVHEELATDVVSLLRISNVRAYEIIISKLLTYVLVSLLMVSVFLLTSTLMGFGAPGSQLSLLVTFLCLALFSISIGILFGVSLGGGKAGQILSVAVIVILMVIGGFFVPLSIYPESVQQFSRLLPSTRLVEALQRVSVLGSTDGVTRSGWIWALLSGGSILLLSSLVLERRLKNLS